MTPQAAMHLDRQAITAQYIRYAYDFNTRNEVAFGQILTRGCQIDVRGKQEPFLPYVRQEWQHSKILKIKIYKIVVTGNTATALIVETNWLKGALLSYSPISRQDLLVRTATGWRISHIHTTGVIVTVVH